MPVDTRVDAEEIKQTDRAIGRFEKALSKDGRPVRKGLARMAGSASRFMASITHIDTHTLARAYGVDQGIGTSGAFAGVFIIPSIVNPRGQRPAEYGPYEFGRGGDHDALGRTFAQASRFVDPNIVLVLKEAALEAKTGA